MRKMFILTKDIFVRFHPQSLRFHVKLIHYHSSFIYVISRMNHLKDRHFMRNKTKIVSFAYLLK